MVTNVMETDGVVQKEWGESTTGPGIRGADGLAE
jgi:hypothetical protein